MEEKHLAKDTSFTIEIPSPYSRSHPHCTVVLLGIARLNWELSMIICVLFHALDPLWSISPLI